MDLRKSLDELEGSSSGTPSFNSYLVQTVHRLRSKPLAQFTVEDLRIMIGQDVGLHFLVPLALDRLHSDPFAAGDFYRGDLLNATLRSRRQFWTERPDLRKELLAIVRCAKQKQQSLTDIERDALHEAIAEFHKPYE